jgi:uncharacterized protein YjbJ (UPF0337 family)
MMSQQTMQANWNEIKGKRRGKWASLTNDDLAIFNRNVDQLVGTIQQKTSAAPESIERFFEQLDSDGAVAIGSAVERARAGAQPAADSIQKTSQKAVAAVRDGYADVEAMVRERPAKSLAVCFAAGAITGAVVTLLWRWR